MAVTFGRTCPKGFLPAYSVDTEAEAVKLIAFVCDRQPGAGGYYMARELADEQTVENLAAFSRRLHKAYQAMARPPRRAKA